MAKRYVIWDKTSDIYTSGVDQNGKSTFTAEEWKNRYPWIKIPGAKMIISAGLINGACAMEFEATKRAYIGYGAEINDSMTDEEVLEAIEAWEDAQNQPNTEPTAEERTAAALEFLAVNSLPDSE